MVMLNVADMTLRSRVNGPGLRSVVWVQGCTIGCPGCFNPHTHAHSPKHMVDPARLALKLAALPDTCGLTFSGGEPFEQAEACSILAKATRELDRTVVVFTGYPFDRLQQSGQSAVRKLMSEVDLLIAGPYVQRLPADVGTWRGSVNQSVHYLTDRIPTPSVHDGSVRPVVEISIHGRTLLSTGFPDRKDLIWLESIG